MCEKGDLSSLALLSLSTSWRTFTLRMLNIQHLVLGMNLYLPCRWLTENPLDCPMGCLTTVLPTETFLSRGLCAMTEAHTLGTVYSHSRAVYGGYMPHAAPNAHQHEVQTWILIGHLNLMSREWSSYALSGSLSSTTAPLVHMLFELADLRRMHHS